MQTKISSYEDAAHEMSMARADIHFYAYVGNESAKLEACDRFVEVMEAAEAAGIDLTPWHQWAKENPDPRQGKRAGKIARVNYLPDGEGVIALAA